MHSINLLQSLLASDSLLPDEREELSEIHDLFKGLFQSLRQEMQEDLDRNIRLVLIYSAQLKTMPLGEGRDSVSASAENCMSVVRGYFDRMRFLGNDQAKLEALHDGLSEEERRDIIPRVLSFQFDNPSQRAESVLLFRRIPLDKRDKLTSAVSYLAKFCTTDLIQRHLEMFFRNVAEEAFPSYLPYLAFMLSRCNMSEWALTALEMGTHKQKIVPTLAKILKPVPKIGGQELSDLIKVAILFQDTPQVLRASTPLFLRCTDGACLSRIAYVVAKVQDPDRGRLVREVAEDVQEVTKGKQVYRRLLEVIFHRRNIEANRILVSPREIDIYLRLEPSRFETLLNSPLYQGADIIIHSDELEMHPCSVLRSFVAFIEREQPSRITVNVLGTPFPSQEIVPKLLTSICRFMHFTELSNGLFRPEMRALTPVEKSSYRDLGKFLMFCLRRGLVVGNIFDKSLFIALKLLSEEHLQTDISEETFDLFYPIYKAMRSHNEEDVRALAVCEREMGVEAKENLLESMSMALEPCMVMKSEMMLPLGVTAEELEIRLQGNLTADQILKQIQFIGASPEQQLSIEKWLLALDHDPVKMRHFLSMVTGAPGLGPNPIRIEIHGDALGVFISDQKLRLPEKVSIDLALEELDVILRVETCFLKKLPQK